MLAMPYSSRCLCVHVVRHAGLADVETDGRSSQCWRFGEHWVVAVVGRQERRFGQSVDEAHRLERLFDRKALDGRVGPTV